MNYQHRLNQMRQNNFRIFKERRTSSRGTRDAKPPMHRARHIGGLAKLPNRENFVGGASRDRTGDLLLAKQALSQLSYGP